MYVYMYIYVTYMTSRCSSSGCAATKYGGAPGEIASCFYDGAAGVSVLKCVAVSCSAFQCVAGNCRVL